ncbi:pilus assembly protein [Salmonella enterica subsp. enterica]|nr:pilus assembly protein [Salmonella enterica subsp. enterica serovar Hvittingfoss]
MAGEPLLQKNRTQVLRRQRQCWVAGLRWEEKQKPVRRPLVQRRDVLSVALTVRQGKRRLTAQGNIEAGWRHRKLYSLAALFSQQCTPDGYGVYQLDDGRQIFLATVKGMPSPMADVTGTPEQISRALALFLSFNPPPGDGWTIPSPPDAPRSWETLVGQVSPAQLRFARVAGVSNPWRAYGAGVLSLAVLLGGVVWWSRLPEPPVAPVVPALPAPGQAGVKKAPEPVYLPHPWAEMPVAGHFLTRCQRWRAAVPVSLDRWRLGRLRCSTAGLETVYRRQPGGTAARFAARVKQVFNRTPVFNLVSGGNEGVVFLPWANFTLQDEPAPEAGAQLMQAVSWFQSRQVSFSLSEVKVPPALPGEGAGQGTPPVQDWREYTFSITDKHWPAWILQGLDMQGVRLRSVGYTLSPQGQFTYQIEGHLYARK